MLKNKALKNLTLFCIFLLVIAVAAVSLALAIGSIRQEEKLPEPEAVSTPIPESTPVPPVTPHPIGEKKQTDGGLGPDIFLPSEFPGTVVSLNYTTRDYAFRGETEKTMRVYLPYGYSADNRYDVLILLHGYGGTEEYWLDEIRWYNDPDWCAAYEGHLQNILDNMIANQFCKPVIVVSPTYYLNDSWREIGDVTSRDAIQFRSELVQDILPAIVSNFSTYAEGADRESLSKARDHFGFIGASHGAVIGSAGILPDDLDVISWFGLVSGYETSEAWIENCWSKNGFDDFQMNYLYFSAGEEDFLRDETVGGYREFQFCSKIDEDRIGYTEIRDSGHEDIVWLDAVYNCLLIFFQK